MICQSRWALRVAICEIAILVGVDLPTIGQPYMNCQSRWALRVAICEIAILMGGVDLPTLGLPHMTCQSRWALRAGICEIAILWGRSAYTWSATWAVRVSELSEK